jgi:hypothetical protein
MASNKSTEVKLLTRGAYYMTPLSPFHLDEISENLSHENRRELRLLGYTDLRLAMSEMYEQSEAYIVRKKDGPIIFAGGLWYAEDQDYPQMFALFMKDAMNSYTTLARGSKMLVDFLSETQDHMTMTILSEYEGMANWAVWLGFEPVGVIHSGPYKYIEFIRCNLDENCVYDSTSRPVVH